MGQLRGFVHALPVIGVARRCHCICSPFLRANRLSLDLTQRDVDVFSQVVV
jgi:hypothetical protein